MQAPAPMHVFGEQNQVTDLLAGKGKKATEPGQLTLLRVPPMFVRAVLDANMLGTPFIRLLTNNNLDLSSRVVAELYFVGPTSAGETYLY